MFTNVKYFANGDLEKIKARIVAGGHRELLDINTITYSPTVNFETFMIVLNVACYYGLTIDSMDIGAAFLDATLKDNEIYVTLDQEIVKFLLERYSEYSKYRRDNGTILG